MEQADKPFEHLLSLYEEVSDWLGSDLFAYASLAQIAFILLALVISWLFARLLISRTRRLQGEFPLLQRLSPYVEPLYAPLFALLLIGVASVVGRGFEVPLYLLRVAASLLTAWLVIRLAVNFIRSKAVRQLVAALAWFIAALNILGLLDVITKTLDAARLTLGGVTISALAVISGLMAFFLLVWLALVVARIVESRIDSLSDVSPSARELVKKLARIALVLIAILVAFNMTGIDLTALAVFSGALGVGLGFGLQKVVANFVSGIILLMDRSIKPGDVIETQDTYGWINHLGARYTSIITRDGTEFLIPNEDMITQPVVNWSFSDRKVRRRVKVGVSYNSDIHKAMALMEEAALTVDRVLPDPEPAARLLGFGDSAVDLELRIWIEDPQSGVANVASEVMLAIWDRFHEAGIEFPFPQRVVHFANSSINSPTNSGERPVNQDSTPLEQKD